jgi:hypothetical protein
LASGSSSGRKNPAPVSSFIAMFEHGRYHNRTLNKSG